MGWRMREKEIGIFNRSLVLIGRNQDVDESLTKKSLRMKKVDKSDRETTVAIIKEAHASPSRIHTHGISFTRVWLISPSTSLITLLKRFKREREGERERAAETVCFAAKEKNQKVKRLFVPPFVDTAPSVSTQRGLPSFRDDDEQSHEYKRYTRREEVQCATGTPPP